MEFQESVRENFIKIRSRLTDREINPGLLFIAPAVLLMLVLITYPLIETFRLSLHNLTSGGVENFVGVSKYVTLFTSNWFPNVMFNTFVWVVGGVALQLVVGFGLALLLNTKFPAKSAVRAGFLIPWVTPTIVTSIIFSWMYSPQFGIVNELLVRGGLINEGIAWLGNPDTAMFAVIVSALWKQFPFVMIMVLAGLQGMDESLHNAAKIDGAPFFARLRHITIPSLLPVLKIVLLLTVIWMFNQFVLIFTMTGGGPVGSTNVLSVKVYRLAFQQFRYGDASALSVVMIMIMLVFIFFYIRALRKRGGSI
ncbi:carbohydrate ABC transporter permease [Haloarcula nitratireducens]|uniref:Sugar ABC transporter permease n=1 Tax=Haloarcula nitratireducens TaxID=2487749 RepID=A0AAW4PHF4_9EURY|nr:sugar ABC transporter permease [Halomicroarcula nitratireducens]MBX0296951.1 sugar ABC transporter permease [Halomicroarcula nitratireducens]